MTGDSVFPIPDPSGWLFKDEFTIHNSASVIYDDRGNAVDKQWNDQTVTGYVSAPDKRIDPAAYGADVTRFDAVALAPLGTVVGAADEVTVSSSTIQSYLHGRYKVEVVRPNLSHLRIMLTRISAPFNTPNP